MNQTIDESIDQYRFNSSVAKYSINLSYRKYLWRIMFCILIIAKFSQIWLQSTPKIYRVFQLIGLSDVPKWGPLFLKNWLNTKIPSEYVTQYPLMIGILILVLYIVWLLLVCKTTKITINSKFIEVREGVLNRKIDSINLVDVRDEPINIPWYDRLIKLSHLNIKSTDKTTPNLNLQGLDATEAEHFMNYIRQNAYQNYTEFRISNDRQAQSKRRSKKDKENEVMNNDDDDNVIVDDSKSNGRGDNADE